MSKQTGASRTDFHYDTAGHLLAESDGAGAVLREYVWLGDLPLALVADPGGDPCTYWVHADHLGTPQRMTDGIGAVVWDATWGPFGEAFTLSGFAVNPRRFPGQQVDEESGWHANWWRTYDPLLGRYLQSDPIGLIGGLNRYAYVEENPVNKIDLNGNNTIVLGAEIGGTLGGPVGAAAGAAIGGAIGVCMLSPACSGTTPDALNNEKISDGATVGEILKGNKGSIKNAPMPAGCPAWDDIRDETWREVKDKASNNVPGYKAIKKLLGDRRFDK